MLEIKVPALGESIVEATVGEWRKRPGDPVAAGEAVVALETDKINLEIAAEQAGTLREILKAEGETVRVGDVLARLDEAASPAPPPTEPAAPAPPAEAPREEAPHPRASPAVRRLAEELGVDLARVSASGPLGRITRDDVIAHAQAQAAAPAPAPAPAPAAPPPPAAPGRREERVRMSRRRLTIARRLVEAQHTAAMLTTFNEVDMSAILQLRQKHRQTFQERYGVRLGFMSFFAKAVVGALKAFPQLNAEIQGEEMVLKYYYDIGIAVATDAGLVVPVIRDVDRLSFAEIERQVEDLAQRARRNELRLEELQGGTFTITNGGVFGSLLSTPILNPPQVGILGMHRVQERPVVVDGQIVVRPMMYVALSYDHRIVDGSEAVRFLVRVKELLEDPERLLLEG